MAYIKRTRYGYRADWRDKQGNRYRKTVALKKDAEDFVARVTVDIKDRKYLTAKTAPLFRAVAERWFEGKRRRPATLAQYRMHLDTYLLPAFGEIPMSDISVTVIEAQCARWAKQQNARCKSGHLSPQKLNKLLTTLTGIFEFARERGECVGNAAEDAARLETGSVEIGAEVGRRDPDEVSPDEVLNPDEMRQLIDHAAAGY